MMKPQVKALWGRARDTVSRDTVSDAVAVAPALEDRRIDPVSEIACLVAERAAELDSESGYSPANRFLIQAIELALLPSGAPRQKYVKYFYQLGSTRRYTVPVRKAADLGSGKERLELGLWFSLRHSAVWSQAARKGWWPKWSGEPLRRDYLAAIALASEVVQEIRFLHDIAMEAFDTAAVVPVDVDDHLVSITHQLLGAADVRAEIGAEPEGATAEIDHARRLWQRQIHDLDTKVWRPVLHRIFALTVYRDRLQAVRVRNDTVERISKGADVSADIGTLVAASGHDVLGVSSIIETSADLHAAEAARSSALAEVRGDYLNALMP